LKESGSEPKCTWKDGQIHHKHHNRRSDKNSNRELKNIKGKIVPLHTMKAYAGGGGGGGE